MATSIGPKIGIDGEKEYKNAIKGIVQETKTLDAQLKEVASRMDDETNSMKNNQDKTELLSKKKEALTKELELMADKLEDLQNSTDDTTQAENKLQEQMAKVQTQLNKTNSELDKCADSADDAKSPLEELNDTISDQEKELADLKEAYTNAYLEFGATSDECQELASQIDEVSAELETNRSTLANATGAADGLASSYDEVSDSASTAGSNVSESFEGVDGSIDSVAQNVGALGGEFGTASINMAQAILEGGVMGAVSTLVEALPGIAAAAWEMAEEWDSACDTMAISTGIFGDELKSLEENMSGVYAGTRNMGITEEEVAALSGEIVTMFGYSGDELEKFGIKVSEFAGTHGVDAVKTVDDIYRTMKLWGEEAGTEAEIMDKLTKAAQDSGLSVDEMNSILLKNQGAFESLGMTYDEAINFMMNYRKAGGDVNDMTKMLTTAQKNLADTPHAEYIFGAAIETMSKYTNTAEAMNATIGTTGMTIKDLFGDGKLGQQMAQVFTDGKFAMEDMINAGDGWQGQLERTSIATDDFVDQQDRVWRQVAADTGDAVYEAVNYMGSWDAALEQVRYSSAGMVELTDSAFAAFKDSAAYGVDGVADAFTRMAELSGQSVEGLVYGLYTGQASVESMAEATNVSSDKIQAAVDAYSEVFSNVGVEGPNKSAEAVEEMAATSSSSTQQAGKNIEQNMSKGAKGAETAVKTSMTNAQNSVSTSTKSMVSSASNAWDRISSIFSTAIQLHFSAPILEATATGVKKVGTQRFAQGYNAAMMLKQPTIFGAAGNNLLVGGDRSGAEIVVGETHLMNMFTNAVRNALGYTNGYGGGNTTNNYGGNAVNVNVYGAPGQDVRELANLVSKQINKQVNVRRSV